ncbi:MAG: heavy metal translocating P-type ATPase [Bacteroidota bacterium]
MNQLACTHCGEPCLEDQIVETDVQFCCSGCQTVYHILKDNGLSDFYRLDNAAGQSQRNNSTDYSWLSVPELQAPFIQFQDDQHTRVQLDLPAIHCTSCIWLLEHLNRLHEGVSSVQVNFGLKRATILFRQAKISIQELSELLAKIGYPPLYRSDHDQTQSLPNRRLLYQIGLAGFVFGNIMLFSFPEYLGLGIDLAGERFEQLFGYLNLILIIPVLLYSGRDYLLAAYRALSQGVATVDLPISLGIMALFGRSAYEVLSQSGPGYFDSLAGLLFFLLIGKWFQSRTFSRLSFDRDYRAYFPVAARRKESNGQLTPVALDRIQIGDRLQLRPGDLIPVDGILSAQQQVGVDYSFVTGESAPQLRQDGDLIYAGGRATQQAFEVVATKAVEQSYLLQLWRDQEGAPSSLEQNLTDRASKYFTLAVVIIGLATLAYWWPSDPAKAAYAATSVLIIACPCALALAIPFTYGAIIRVMGRYGFYLRSVQVIEKIQGLQHFIFDKTGTLCLSQASTSAPLQAKWNEQDQAIVLAMCLQSKHPKSQTLASYLVNQSIHPAPIESVVTESIGQGLSFQEYRLGQPAFCQLQEATPQNAKLCVAKNGQLLAAFGAMSNQLRPGWEQVLEQLSTNGELHLLSGDYQPSTQDWSDQIPLGNCHFEQSPFAKRAYVSALQKGGKKVAMLGDGLNDAGALNTADVGIAISEDQSSFSPASDAILAASSFPQFADLLGFIKRCRWMLYLAFAVAIAYNIIGLSFAVQGELSPVIAAILMPLSSISIVLIGLGGVYLMAWFSRLKTDQWKK